MWVRVCVFLTIGCVGVGGYFGGAAIRKRRQIDAIVAVELAAADASRAEQSRSGRAVSRAGTVAVPVAAVADALADLSSEAPATQCDAARQLARLGAREHTASLRALLSPESPARTRGCAASALVTLGEWETPLRAYDQWANGDDPELRRHAIAGFGEIGPPAAAIALPHLTAALESPHLELRDLAAAALSRLAPSTQR
jgi:HEAT repeat protein